MTLPGTEGRTSLSRVEYLLDPPPTVWEEVLLLDHATWLDVRKMDVLQRAEGWAEAYGRALPREAWLGLYSAASLLKEQAPETLQVAHALFQRAEKMGEWIMLRRTANGDEIAAAFATGHFVRELIERLPEDLKKEMQEAEAAAAEAEARSAERQMLEAMIAQAQGPRPPGSHGNKAERADRRIPGLCGDRLVERLEQARRRENAARTRFHAARARVDQARQGATARVEQAVSASLTEAKNSLQDLRRASDAIGIGWGLGHGVQLSRTRIAGLEKLAELLGKSEQVRRILDLLGWARQLVAAERRKSRHGRESFTHYQIQELDLEQLAPEELVGLMDPDRNSPIHLDFLRRALDGELLHRQYEGPSEAGRGPFVCVMDKSASMHGLPNATASALELALMQLAVRENRRFVSIAFSGPGNFEVYEPGPRPDPVGLLEHVERSCSGGTEPYAPLAAAVKMIQDDRSLKEGDVLIMTDGEFASPPDEFLNLLEQVRAEPGLKVVAVVVGQMAGEAGFADRLLLVGDLFRDRDQLAKALEALL